MGNGQGRVLVAGATGYVGGRLLAALEASAGPPRPACLARRPEALRDRVAATTEVIAGGLSRQRFARAPRWQGVETAYYLVHSMGLGDDFAAQDRAGRPELRRGRGSVGVRRIVYLGGLGSAGVACPPPAQPAGDGELLAAGVPVVEFRAS